MDSPIPVIVGVAQRTIGRGQQPGPEPLDGWADVCRAAAADAGIAFSDLRETGLLAVVDCLSWEYDDQVGRLAEKLSARPRVQYRSAPSGTSGQVMMAKAADAIRAGEADIAVLCGGESLATRRWYAKAGEPLPWSHPAPPGTAPSFDLEGQQHPGEAAIGLLGGVGAIYTFAMRDVARRAHLGIAPDDYRRQIGTMMAGFTRVAARNPDAWFPVERDADFLTDPRPDNRMISYPYTKHMVAIMDVDMFGALILMSEAKADELGVARDRRIYPWAHCYAADPDYTAVRPNLWRSEAMAAASGAVLDAAGVAIKDVGHIDIYSCFPAAVNFARDALGIAQVDGERVTVTGGLPYGGGPGSSYMMTSLVKLVERLRADPGGFGLASGVGMMMTHHAFGLYSSRPPVGVAPVDQAAVQAAVDTVPELPVRSDYSGPVTVATYTLMYDPDGTPVAGAAICDLPDGSRTHARMIDPALLREAESTELVGRTVHMVEGEQAGVISLA